MSGDRPVSVLRGTLETVAVYVFDDRIEVGRTSPFGVERLHRVVLRDATRLEVWLDRRRVSWILGLVLASGAALGLAASLAIADDGGRLVAQIFAALGLLVGLAAIWSGRAATLTRFRLEGTRGEITGVLRGRRRKRDEIVRDLVERIHARQQRED